MRRRCASGLNPLCNVVVWLFSIPTQRRPTSLVLKLFWARSKIRSQPTQALKTTLCLKKVPNVAWAEAYLPTNWHLDPPSHLATTDMGRKLGAVPLWEGDGSPSNTMWPGPSPTRIQSFILIRTNLLKNCPSYLNCIVSLYLRKLTIRDHRQYYQYKQNFPSLLTTQYLQNS